MLFRCLGVKKNLKIDILGTTYSIERDDSLKESDLDGLCKEYDKKITVRSPETMLCDDDLSETKLKRYKEVLRHEITHAFFSESGLDDYSSNEQLINWLAIQFPKMLQAFKEADCL